MKIKDICTSVTDGSHNPPQGIEKSEYMMLSSKNIFDDEITFDEPRFLSEKDFEREHKRTQIAVGDVLLTIVGTVGRTAVVDEDMPAFALQRSVAVLHPKNDVCLPRFLMYALRGKRTYIENRAKGVAQKGIYLKEVSDIDIYIPDISNQEIIINKLDKVNTIIKLRQEELLALDNLIKARFVEMFYDKGYPILKWNDVFNTTTGKLDSNAAVEDGEYPFFTCSKEVLRIDKFAFDQEALLLAGNNAAGKYDVKYYNGKFNAYQRTYVLGLKEDWSYQLFRYQLEDKLVYLQQQSLGGLTKYLTMKILGKLDFIIPPIEKQIAFEVFANQVNKSKVAVQKALDETQMLFDSLMQEYFG